MKRLAAVIFFIFLIGQISTMAQNSKKTELLKVASFNIQYDNSKDKVNTWVKRLPSVAKVFNKYQFDIVGAQEPYLSQIKGLLELIPGYTYIGINILGGTDILNRHYTPIFYKKDKFEVLDWGTYWYSETPDVPSKGWDAFSMRICTWAKFKEKESGSEFYFFNNHLDHIGIKARQESVQLLLTKIKVIAEGYPVIVTGDFNLNQHHANYATLNNSGLIKDSYHLAKNRRNSEMTTYNGYKQDLNGSNRIDHLFVSLNPAIEVRSYRILTDMLKGIYPSDHFPVMLEINIPTKTK
ncbi:MAG: endonuclease/exonuclease/phosphatase family protein [Pedobacter sp.]|uniref:endonuclease/exonuclease/phosphatase family protein n=1 Tax=Pedobacter sp. TaxID=1411316 RepID=UPI003567025B